MRRDLVAACGFFVSACKLLVAARTRDLAPRAGIEPGPPALGARSLTHWTTRGVPAIDILTRIALGLSLGLLQSMALSSLCPFVKRPTLYWAHAFHFKCISRYYITCCSSCWCCDKRVFSLILFSNWISQEYKKDIDFSYLLYTPASY